MYKRAFQGLKRTFIHVSGLPQHILITNSIYKVIAFLNQNTVGKDLRHA